MLAPTNQEIKIYPPSKLEKPFTTEEISQTASKLKNGKSAGCDGTQAEYIKYAPVEIHKQIAIIFNQITETGEQLKELNLGILTPLQKPGKKKGPPENIRPIILLSVIRKKILTICMMKRIWNCLSKDIPTEQAAYQPGGTTEHVWAVKMITEKATISSNYKIYLILLDMSQAFDTVNRKILFDHLEETLAPDELYIMSRLINNPEIQVKVCQEYGNRFKSTVGIMQGDCLSAVLFIYYLAKCLKEEQTQMYGLYLCPKYADDITYVTTSLEKLEEIEKDTPPKLKSYNLQVNQSKTEKYQIPRPIPEQYLPGLDINTNKNVLWSELDWIANIQPVTPENTSTNWNAYAASIFLYNSETWTQTESHIKQIDSFHRRLMRTVLHVRWPRIIKK